MMRGATKEKSRKLDELKARRRAKDEKQRVCVILIISAQYRLKPPDKGVPQAGSFVLANGHGDLG
jgi:hypothetical protein